MTRNRFGEAVRAARHANELTLKQLGASVGVSESYVSYIESGKSEPAVPTALEIADALGVDVDRVLAKVGKNGSVLIIASDPTTKRKVLDAIASELEREYPLGSGE